MEGSEQITSKIDKKLENFDKKFTMLQDLLLTMKNKFDLFSNLNIQEAYLSKFTKLADEDIDVFRSERPDKCPVSEKCTNWYEKSIFKVIRVFMSQGSYSALETLKNKQDYGKKIAQNTNCPDEKCLNNVIKTFNALEELISASVDVSAKNTRELLMLDQDSLFEDGCEEEICNLLAPLSNAIRLKILKTLYKEGLYYTQLERIMGIKGGHLQHHLRNLMEANYIERINGKYVVTVNGLKMLKFLTALKMEL